MKLGAPKAERRPAQPASDRAGGMTDDPTSSDIAKLHLLDHCADGLDGFERTHLREDAGRVRPDGQSVSELELSDAALAFEDRGLDVRTAKRQPCCESADPGADDEHLRHACHPKRESSGRVTPRTSSRHE